MITTAAREGKKKITPYMPQEGVGGMAYHGLVVGMVSLTVNYLVIPFQVCVVCRVSSTRGLGLESSADPHGSRCDRHIRKTYCWDALSRPIPS